MSSEYQKWLKDHALSEKDLATLGCHFDQTFNRIVIPVHSPGGAYVLDVIRNLDRDAIKYDLRPDKCRPSHTLYNLHRVRSTLINHDIAVVTEGFSDALALFKAHYPAVASLTSSLSLVQASILRGLVSEIVIFGDDDDAGRDFASRALDNLPIKAMGLIVTGHDPASLRASGANMARIFDVMVNGLEQFLYMEVTPEGKLVDAIERTGRILTNWSNHAIL